MNIKGALEQIFKIDIENVDSFIKDFSNSIKDFEIFLNFLKNYHNELAIKIEKLDLSEFDLKKSILFYLNLKNQIKSIIKNPVEIELKFLELVKELPQEIQEILIKVYIILGIYLIKNKIEGEEFKLHKILLKYFHDLGGFEEGIWGIKINFPLFQIIIYSINETMIKKLEKSYKNPTLDDLLVLNNIFQLNKFKS